MAFNQSSNETNPQKLTILSAWQLSFPGKMEKQSLTFRNAVLQFAEADAKTPIRIREPIESTSYRVNGRLFADDP
jgi:hypothetical protein